MCHGSMLQPPNVVHVAGVLEFIDLIRTNPVAKNMD